MDINDERKKKLEAGKEKLAAFRKKKAKSKKNVKDTGENLNLKDVVEPLNGDTDSPTDDFAAGLIQPFENNDHIILASGDGLSAKEQETQKLDLSGEKFPQQQIVSSEEAMGLEPAIKETVLPINEQNTNNNCKLETDDFRDNYLVADVELSELENALAQRDKLIGQLTHSLKSNTDQQSEKEELASQVLSLAQQVTELQTQLKEAGQTLQEQLQFHGISTSALQSAKSQMLQLQSIVHTRNEELLLASQQLENSCESLCNSQDENARLSQKLSEQSEELNNLQQCYDAAVSSHVEKQEREESEKSHQLVEFQRQWWEREEELKSSLDSQTKEIEDWKKCEEEWKKREFELKENYVNLVNRLHQEGEKEERLKELEHELEELRQQNEVLATEAASLKKENEEMDSSHKSCLSKHNALTDENWQLSLLHSNMVDEFELLKSKNSVLEESLRQLNLDTDSVRSELEDLSSKLEEKEHNLKSSIEQNAEIESKHRAECDKLNNKINELQGNISVIKESYDATEKALIEEKGAVNILQQELLAKESNIAMTSQELCSMTSKNSDLQSELQGKEDEIKELKNLFKEKSNAEEAVKNEGEDKIKLKENVDKLTKELNEFKTECEKYAEQISRLQNEGVLAMKKVETLCNELDEKNESLSSENQKCRKVEAQLETVKEEKGVLSETIKALNNEILILKDDLKNDDLQVDILGEELVSVNSKLVDSHSSMQLITLERKNSQDEHSALIEQFRSEIAELQRDVERFTELSNDLDLKLVSSTQGLDKLNVELKDSEESLKLKTKYCECLEAEMENVKEGEKLSVCKINDLEDELKNAKFEHQEMAEREKELLQNQEEMQRQLENTVSQWQKLQLIVQEKEIELQNLNDDLEEQKRICTTMKKNHEEDLNSFHFEVGALKQESDSKDTRVAELEGMLKNIQESLAAKDVELSDTMTKVEAVDTSSQNLAMHLSEKDKELNFMVSDKERVNIELSDRIKEIACLKEDLSKANDEIACLSENLDIANMETSTLKTNLKVEREEKEAALKCLENKNQELSHKERETSLRMEGLQAQIADAQKGVSESNEKKSMLEAQISELKSTCHEKEELLAEQYNIQAELQNLLDKEQQQGIKMLGELSFLSQDVNSKEELLMMNSAELQEKVGEIHRKEAEQIKCSQDFESSQEELKKAIMEIEAMHSKLELLTKDKESLIGEIQKRDTELNQIAANRDDSNAGILVLKDKLRELDTETEKRAEEMIQLNSQLLQLQNSLGEKDQLYSKEQDKVKHLMKEIDRETQQHVQLKITLSSQFEDLQLKEELLLQQGVLLDERITEVSKLKTELNEKECMIQGLQNNNTKLVTRIEELVSKESSGEAEVAELREQIDKYDHDLAELSAVNKEVSDHLAYLKQEVKQKEGELFNVKQDNEIIQKECIDLRADLQEKEDKNLNLVNEVDLANAALRTSNEEKELLKSNFDYCLEEMQQKSSAQEVQMSHLKSKLTEESKNRDQGEEEIKEIYIQQLAQVEDKLIAMEREKIQVEKEMEEKQSQLDKIKEEYEQQVSDLELSVQEAQFNAAKMSDTISKINSDHEKELTDLKSLHELQMSELMDSYLSLEKSMAELQKSLSDQSENMKQERNEMEQSFENLMSEMDERKRRSDSDINRLKKQQEEMNKDHERELKALEKNYETQLFDLEDRCSVVSSELERARKSAVGVGDFVEERRYLENKIEDLENIRRELEIKCNTLEDDISLRKEQSILREEEVKAILKTAAEKQCEMRSDMEDLEERLRVVKMDRKSSGESTRKEFESKIEDLNAENKHLKSRLKSFERHVELDMEMRDHEMDKGETELLNSRLEEMKKQMATLTDENLSLKRRVLGHKSLEKKARLLSGVEDICPPLEDPSQEDIVLPSQMTLLTSTPSKKGYENDAPFSPTAEEVSLIEGFVSETSKKPITAHKFENINSQRSADEEPDFVAEEQDRFQPETVIEKAVDEFDNVNLKQNIHPILEHVVTEGFQPEVSDQFFVEVTEESNTEWPLELSVGLSPTSKKAPQFFCDETDRVGEEFQPNDVHSLGQRTNCSEPVMNRICGDKEKQIVDELVEKRIKQIEEDLEEKYTFKLRKQQQDIVIEYETRNENIERELVQHFAQKELSIKHDWEIKFAKALKKMKKDFNKKMQKILSSQAYHNPKIKPSQNDSAINNQGEEEDIVEEESEELGDVVEQLSKENQELAEVRDELLKEIEISQARGLHSRMQHQLQSMLSEREKENASSPQDVSISSENDAVVEPDCVQTETVALSVASPGAAKSPTVAAEMFLEELEDISQQSSQDLPLEWELTNTIPTEAGVSENEPGHHSVWEVFGSRCVRKDCQELDALRSQYDSQLSALQGQLEAARSQNQHSMDASQHSYEEFMSTFREKLDGDQKDLLDELIAKLTTVHHGQIQELEDKNKDNVSMEVLAVKTALEQVYMSKSQLEVSSVKAKHEEQIEEMKANMEKDYKEKLNKMMADQKKGNLDSSLTDKYNELIQKISQALDDKIVTNIEASISCKAAPDGDTPSENDCHESLSKEIRNLLMNQQEEISSLRSQLLGDYESVLQSRTQSMMEQTQEVTDLEEQLKILQTQYSEQVASFQDMLASRDEEQKKSSENEKSKYEQQQAELKNHYEKRVQEMEASFEKEINCIKEKYEDQISGLVHARLGLDNGLPDTQSKDNASQSAAIDTDSDNADTPRSSDTGTTLHINELEKELKERDAQIQELMTCIDYNRDEFKKRVEELEEELQSAKTTCSKLEAVVEGNKHVIETLELEKKESEKLYKDLLEKESPRSKGSAIRDYHSSDSVDDSFSSAREEIQDTPRSLDSLDLPGEGGALAQKNTTKDNDLVFNGEEDKDDEHNNTIPFANDSVESDFTAESNSNNNNNNNNNSTSCLQSTTLEEQISNLKDQVEDLNRQLEEVKASEEKLQSHIEESQHEHLELMENLRQELEHEKQVEVETLQSEFKVQMDVELKKQASELKQVQEAAQVSSPSCPVEQQTQTSQSDVNIDGKLYSTLEMADDDIMEASSSNMFLQTTNFELQTVVMTKGEEELEENLSDDSKVTSNLSPICSPTHSTTTLAPVTQSLPLTDMEKEVQVIKDEYEGKMARLSSEVKRMNEEQESLSVSHQQRVEELESQLNETEARYDRLMEGVQSGDHPELNQLMKDKYDQELDLATSLMQKDFDEMLKEEKKKFMEHHRKLMSDFMEDKNNEDEEAEKKHEQELKDLKERLAADFETKAQSYEHEGLNSASPSSEQSIDTSTPIKSPGLSYEESDEEETDAEKITTLQVRSFTDTVKAPSPSPCLLKEKEQLELKVQQLVAQVERLTQQLVERQDSAPVSLLHSPHNTTLKADDPALITMLQSDLERIGAERESVHTTNDRLLSLLSDTVKTYIGVEDTINRKLTQVVSGTPRSQSHGGDSGDGSRAGSVELGPRHGPSGDSQSSRQGSPAGDYLKGASPDVDSSQDSHALDNTSILSNATDEGLEISQRLAESIFVGPDLDAEGEEILSDARGRLTSAVDQLLELMEQSTIQLHEAKSTQEDLLATLASRARDVESSQSRSFELNSQLSAEIEAKEYLGLELHKAEGLIAGYVADREANEKQIQNLEEQREALIVELDSTRSRLEDFQQSQSEIDAVREELSHQQTLLRENVGQETQALLNEVSNLNQERRELATQLQHQLDLSRKRLSEMEALAEEAERKHESVVEEKNQALEDLGLQLENTERQLKSSKAFVDELLVEREQEREEHQKEIDKMKATIEGKDRSANSQDRMQREIADLTEQLQARIATQTTMHQRIVDLQKVLEDKELGANDLKIWVSQLEGELDQKFSEEDQLKERISKLERQLTEQSENNEEEVENVIKLVSPRSDIDSEESSNATSSIILGPQPSVVSLEEELQKSKETKEELDLENNTLKQQLHDQMLQISGLKNQIDQMRHYASADDSDAAQLRERLAQERDQVEKKEAELAEAERKTERLESILKTKQLEAEELNSKVSRILEMGDTQEENERLRNDLQELRSQMSEMSSSSPPNQLSMPANLLDEKNEEISELKTRLQAVEAQVEEKMEQVTINEEKILHLHQRLKDRDEEIGDLQDSLASARRGEACLDMSLPLTDDVGSMLNISMTGRTSIQQEFEDTIAQREGEVQSLEQQTATLKKDLEKTKSELSTKTEDEEKIKSELSEKDEEIQKLQEELLQVAKESDELKSSLENLQTEKENQTDQQKMVEFLEESVQEKENNIYQLTLENQELKSQLEEAAQATESMEKVIEQKDAELTQAQEERDEKRDQLQEKEHKLDQMIIQIEGLQTEISGLTTFQMELQKDYDTIQSMLDEKEKVLDTLTQELTDTKAQQDALESMIQLEAMVTSLKKDLVEKQNVVEEKEEELYELQDKLEDMEKEKNIKSLTNEIESLKSQIEEQDRVILSLRDELEISGASHEEQLLFRDNQISELRETVHRLKPSTSLEKVQSSEGNALSPRTKEQISQLKTQLRKAHAALEEMQGNSGQKMRETDDVDGGQFIHQAELEALRKIVQEQEEELVILKSEKNGIKDLPVVEETIQTDKIASVESLDHTKAQNSRDQSKDDFSFVSSLSNFDGVPPRIQALLDRLHNLGEDLLSASDFEYLQQHLFQQPATDGSSSDTSAWSRERAALMDTIVAIKELLQQADRLAAKSVEDLSGSGDWRAELLDSLMQVYQGEKQVLRAEVGTANTSYPEMDIVMQLESRIHDLEQVHQRGLDEMLKADRQSLLDEVDNLHHRLLEAKAQLEDTRHTLDQRIAELEKAKSNAEWKLERQIQMLEYKIQQEGVIQEDLKKSLNLERQRVSELSSQSSHERSKTYELQSELSSTQIQLSKVRDALEREQHRFNSVTMDWSFSIDALEEEQAKTVHLTELLDSTKKKLKHLKEEITHHEAQQQKSTDSEELVEDLKTELQNEKQKSYEFSEAEEHAQRQIAQLSEKLDNLKKKLISTKGDYEAKIENLHREWMERELQERQESETDTVTKLTDLLDVERESHQKALEKERLAARQLREALEEIKSENDRLLHLYEVERSRVEKLKKETDKNEASNDMLRHLRTTEQEASQLQQKVLELEEELSHVQDRAAALEAELSRGPNSHITSDPACGEYHREAISSLMTASYIDEELKVRLAQCCTRLQMIASKLQDMTGQATQGQGYSNGDDTDGGLDGSTGLQIVMEELEKLKSNIREREEKRQNTMENDRTVQADQLLQHNKQLAEHVKKLKLEKEQLTGAMKKMEEDKKRKMVLPQYTSDVTSDEEGVYDRTVWASEKLSLQMALDSAEHEIQHLRTELKKFSSLTKADGQLLKLDPDKTQRLYGKYLRAESFRKALIYQKKYLLLLLGGYRDTEQETLAILASMGGFPSPRTRVHQCPVRSRPLATFRSVGRTVIAIFRMKYLVRKWKRATRVGSPVMTGLITTQHAYIPTSASSYALPHNRQQQQKPHLNNNHHHISSPSSLAIVGTSNSRVSSDYVESLTNGGLSSLVYSKSDRSRTQPSSTAASTTSNHSHQVPSHQYQHPHNNNYNTTPPTKESSKSHNFKAARGNRDSARRQILQDATSDSDSSASRGNARSQGQSSDDENFMRYLENVQQQLSEGSSSSRRISSWR